MVRNRTKNGQVNKIDKQREKYIMDIKKKIQEGSYNIDPNELAKALMDEMTLRRWLMGDDN